LAQTPDPGADARTESRGVAVAISIVVAMALAVLGLGLSGAFSHEPQPGDLYGRRPTVAIGGPLARGPARGHAYLLVRPALTRADAQRIFAEAGITARVHEGRATDAHRDRRPDRPRACPAHGCGHRVAHGRGRSRRERNVSGLRLEAAHIARHAFFDLVAAHGRTPQRRRQPVRERRLAATSGPAHDHECRGLRVHDDRLPAQPGTQRPRKTTSLDPAFPRWGSVVPFHP
jgi:hypothetical protein